MHEIHSFGNFFDVARNPLDFAGSLAWKHVCLRFAGIFENAFNVAPTQAQLDHLFAAWNDFYQAAQSQAAWDL